MTQMRFDNTQVFNIEGALRGMRYPMKGVGDTQGDVIGELDMVVATKLWNASEIDNLAHSKFLRQILVSVDITAPIYFWAEMDTYKVGTTANSESTMHKLNTDAKLLVLADFQCDPELNDFMQNIILPKMMEIAETPDYKIAKRRRLLKQLLPGSYLQKRHWTANYEIIRNIFNQRYNHRLTEWSVDFVKWARSLPYAKEFLTKRENK